MSRVSYVRVSSVGQNTERQIFEGVIDKTFTDKCSGKDTNRPAWTQCNEYLREGDVLVVYSIDRLARSVKNLLQIVEDLNGRGITVEFVKQGLTFSADNNNPTSKLMLTILGAVAELELSLIKERQLEGIEIAKAKGVYTGRVPVLTEEQIVLFNEKLKLGIPITKVAKEFGIGRTSAYKYKRI